MKKLVLFCGILLGNILWGAVSSEDVATIVHQKFLKSAEKVPLDESHPAIRAAHRLEGRNKETALELCHVFQKDLNIIIGWLKHEALNPDNIYHTWRDSPPQRPIIKAGKLWKQESVAVGGLEEYLTTPGRWRGFPLVVKDDYHNVVLKIQKKEDAQSVGVDFYDPYEPFDEGSYLELKVREILDFKVFKDQEQPVEWRAHYLKHQKEIAFGECSLYAAVYRSLLVKGLQPETFSDREISEKVAALREIIRDNYPEYFAAYDNIFQFAFDSKFADLLLEEIRHLPATWGIEPDLTPPSL